MDSHMTALVNFALQSGSVELRELPIPEIGEDDVLLAVEAVGVCGSDLHQWHGTHSWKVNYPCILGHEFGGTVASTGKRVKLFREGDRVVSETAAVIDPASPLSRQGLYNLEPTRLGFGYGVDGAMASYVRVPERCLHHVPGNLPFETASLAEPCAVAYNAVCQQSPVKPGDSVLVLGPGPIGILCASMAKLSGAGTVIAAGIAGDELRLEAARKMGADVTLTDNVLEYVKQTGDGLGVDVVIDAAGVSPTFRMAMAAVRPAGHITKVGWGPQPMDFNLDPIVQKAVTVQGSFSHNWPIWERVISLLDSGLLDVEPFISRVAPLTDWHECFQKMNGREYVKVVLHPS